MKLLTLDSALFLATATSVLAQASKDYVTKPCEFNKWARCEPSYKRIVIERQCYCKRPLNDLELDARRDELCKTYTSQCLTYGKNFDILQPNDIYCIGICAYCPKATSDASCAEAKAKKYGFQCKSQVVTPPNGFHITDDDIELEDPYKNSIDEMLIDYIYSTYLIICKLHKLIKSTGLRYT